MSRRGVVAVIGVECAKLAAQIPARLVLLACALGPFGFALAMRMQSSLPQDTLFGRSVRESGFAVPLVVLGFAALWVLPVVASVIAGHIFSADDRYNTWKTVLTRSCTRGDLFVGKVATAMAFSVVAVVVLAAASVTAGAVVIGLAPLVNLSGAVLSSRRALFDVMLAWASVVPAICSVAALAVLLSVVTRSSVAGVGVPVVAALAMQLYALVDGPPAVRRSLMTSAFGAWHGLLADPRYYGPIVDDAIVSAAYIVMCLMVAYGVLQRRDVAA